MEKYNPQKIEKKWQKYWEENPDLYSAKDDSDKPKKYILDMFPYPSGEGLHTGHVESYTATDIYSRYFRMKGFNVLHPQGWDSFGLPAENYAIKTGIHPQETTKKAIKTFKRQMNSLGLSYDWEREINTSSKDYYKWTQWLFLLFYKNGLAYKKKGKVNWCSSCQTVLANEQVEDGVCERCKEEVMQKDLDQWYFKITDFIESKGKTSGLIEGLEKVDWPESTKQAQKNWIGKSEGTIIKFAIKSELSSESELSSDFMEVFTTRVDTIFGCTYVVVAPEHEILKQVQDDKLKIENVDEVERYLKEAKKKTDLERMETKEKTGVELKGIKAINPFNGEEVPVFVADYVLGHYGTGAVMAVPAHDERDWEFAKKYNLPVKHVIATSGNRPSDDEAFSREIGTFHGKHWFSNDNDCYTDDGLLFDSGNYENMLSEEARGKMAEWLEEKGIGENKINYKLRDWLVSRQRYWGAPIPIVYCDKCGTVPVPEEQLPVELPTDVDFKPTGESPLKYSKKFQQVKCPSCGGDARRESDTMDTFVCSSWYFLRYADPKNEKEFASKNKLDKWLPVDLYLGGAEHTVLHLLYARFFTKVLNNLGYTDFDEPFSKMRHQGIILAEDGRKMSKSLGNVVNPDEVINELGADSLRLFEMFMGPLEEAKPWKTQGIIGLSRFLERVWEYVRRMKENNGEDWWKNWCNVEKWRKEIHLNKRGDTNKEIKILLNKTIKKVGEDIENLRYNTAISQMMIFVNSFYKTEKVAGNPEGVEYESSLSTFMISEDFRKFLIILSPFAPHIAEELWQKLGHEKSIFEEKWPEYDEALIKDEEIEMPIQVNGKVRDKIIVSPEISEDDAKAKALESEKIQNYLEGQEPKKVIFVKGRLINIVA